MSEVLQLDPQEYQPHETNEPKPRLLSEDELREDALRQFEGKIHDGTLTQEQVETFVREKVTGVKVNGVNVISIDINHMDSTVDPMISAYMNSEKTKVNVVEYFDPEMKKNKVQDAINRTSITRALKTLRNYGRSLQGKSLLPQNYNAQLFYAEKIAEEAAAAEKPVAVMDIADRASFGVAWKAFRNSPLALTASLVLSDNMPHNPTLVGLAATLAGSWSIFVYGQQALDKGIYDRKKVTSLDNATLDFESARRLYLAKGIEQLTSTMQPEQNGEEPQVVSLYPRAHGIRMADILVNPHPTADKIKSGVYKTTAPWLNYAIRTWEHVGKGQSVPGQSPKGEWVQTDTQRITV